MADGSDEHALLLQMSYDLAKLQKQGDSAAGVVDKSLTQMERRAKKAAANLEEAFSFKAMNLEGALGEAISSTRLSLLDNATARVGLFGGALESLGPAGLAGAAGIAAIGGAIEANLKVDEWALGLEHAAHALDLTTTQVQQLRLVAAAGGVDVDKFMEGVSGLNQQIGKIEAGGARSQQLKGFTQALKITPDTLASWGKSGGLQGQLDGVLDAMSKLNPQERAGLAERFFHVDPETLDQLVELRDKIRDATTAGGDMGVMSDAQVKKAAAVEKQLKLTSAVISGQFRQAFVDMSPVILGLQGLLERFSSGLANLAYNARLSAAAIVGFIKTGGGLLGGDPLAGARAVYDEQHAPPPKPDAEPPIKNLITGAPKHHKGDGGAAAALRSSDDDLDAADKLLAEAQKALATSFEARAAFETAELKAEETKAAQKLSADLKKAKTGDERSAIEKAQAETAQAYGLKRQLVANQLAQQLADQANAIDDLIVQGKEGMLRAELALGGTTARRAEIALALFDDDEEVARAKAEGVIASKTASDAEKERAQQEIDNLDASAPARRQKVVNDNAIAASQAAADLRERALQDQVDQLDAEKELHTTTERRRQIALQLFALDEQLQEGKLREQIAQAQLAGEVEKAALLQKQLASLQSTEGARGQAVSNANPVNSWQAWADSAKAATADVGESLAKMRVDGIEALNNSLFNSEGRFNKLGDVARNVARSMIVNFEKFTEQSIEGGLFGGQGGNVQGGAANPLQSLGGMVRGLFGLGGKGGPGGGGVTQQASGTASNPFYVIPADTSGGALTNGWSGIFGQGGGGSSGGLTDITGNGLLANIGREADASAGGGLGGAGGGLSGLLSSLMGGLKSAAGGAASGIGGGLSSLMSLIPGFASGADFTVGGAGGVDKNLMSMRVSRGERVQVTTPAQEAARAGGIGQVHQTFNFPGASVDGFKRSSRQWARSSRMAMQYAGGQ